jgi:predicted acylesterase/phospholipase RssA
MSDTASAVPLTSAAAARLGLALSGGGSRAAAFHLGTLRGLRDIGLLDGIDVVSSVSGGSVFAGAWLASRWKGYDLDRFLSDMARELAQGFVARSLSLRGLRLLLPSYTRSNLLAETFDRVLMHGMRLKDLPEHPLLCINTSVMNTGQVGKFSRHGFSSTGLHAPGSAQASTNPTIPLSDFSVALAATASAAFPVGLPPVYLRRGLHIPEGWGGADLAGHSRFALTDGGVLENLGVQTLLKSRRFAAWNLIISDAGRTEQTWKPGGLGNDLRGVIIGMISFPIIQRVTVMMNSKENRHMRLSAFGDLERSWLIDALRGNTSPGMREYLDGQPVAPRRRMLFIRLDQTLRELFGSIPRWRIHELAARNRQPLPEPLPSISELLPMLGVNLNRALEIHEAMGGDVRIRELNRVSTHFTALPKRDVDDLKAHACWQVHAMHALFNDSAAQAT